MSALHVDNSSTFSLNCATKDVTFMLVQKPRWQIGELDNNFGHNMSNIRRPVGTYFSVAISCHMCIASI